MADMDTSSAAAVVLVLTLAGTLLAVVTGLSAVRRLATGWVLAVLGWLALTALLSRAGLLRTFASPPPRLPLLALVFGAANLALTFTPPLRRALAAMPAAWPIALQTFRVGIELVLYLLYRGGLAPVQVTLEGGNLEVLLALSAPLVAWGARSARTPSRRWLLVGWNVAGLLSLVNIVSRAVRAAPVVLTTVPFVWIPALAVPLAAVAHVVSLRQASSSSSQSSAPSSAKEESS